MAPHETNRSYPSVVTRDDLPKNHMLPIQMRCRFHGDEELASVGMGSRIGHGQQTLLGVSHLEVFIPELGTIDGFASSTIALGEITSLTHEARDDPMKDAAQEVQALSRLALAVLPGAERPKVLRSLGHHVRIKLKDDLACQFWVEKSF